MRSWLLPICMLGAGQPAFADRLAVAEVYRLFQGDWDNDFPRQENDGSCRLGLRRLTLDSEGLGLLIQDIKADGSILREFRYHLPAIPRADDDKVFLEFVGPEVDFSQEKRALRESVSLSMTDADHITAYYGYVRPSDPLALRPHGAEGEMTRCQ